VRTYAFPNGPCDPIFRPSTETSVSEVQLLILVLPTFLTSIG
jgi:hypothetical protein